MAITPYRVQLRFDAPWVEADPAWPGLCKALTIETSEEDSSCPAPAAGNKSVAG
ncbi:hypothetical protein HPP92_028971 [Vanilla planifolia]|uniref:Uncharacterized protein n=1 Tax=Vanilla planifolia TaxID=51239 RepID=A0A835P6I5_VANPL|nr:hypothetical protein HPP92_028971 [Vanilla planifolia]KAG0446171.1 hypothetical protein HPP92_028960 [Vanilla planifolia]